jgi:hypothetical protein
LAVDFVPALQENYYLPEQGMSYDAINAGTGEMMKGHSPYRKVVLVDFNFLKGEY